MKKIYFMIIIVFLLVLTGCDTNYTLTVNNDSINEEINVILPENYLPERTAEEEAAKVEVDDQITPYLTDTQYPIFGDNKNKYTRKIDKKNGMLDVTFSYKYTFDEYERSKIYGKCFDKHYFSHDSKSIYISFLGKFYCMTGDEIVFNIKTSNKVLNHNANKVNGHTYTWVIDKNNIDNVDIEMSISTQKGFVMPIMTIVIITVTVLIFGMLGYGYYQLKNRDALNEI